MGFLVLTFKLFLKQRKYMYLPLFKRKYHSIKANCTLVQKILHPLNSIELFFFSPMIKTNAEVATILINQCHFPQTLKTGEGHYGWLLTSIRLLTLACSVLTCKSYATPPKTKLGQTPLQLSYSREN